MLVLTRRRLEKILIGDSIEITVLEIDPCGRVRIGVTAPREVPIFRAELLGPDDPRRGREDETP